MWHATDDILPIIGRKQTLFEQDLADHASELSELVEKSSFLVLGGAGTIGQAVVKEIFRRKPQRLHVVDLSENNLVELVRDIRSSLGYIDGDFRTTPLDCGSVEFQALLKAEPSYDYILNLSALKHVRSEKDAFTLMRMFCVNVLNTESTLQYAIENGTKKYFGVSSDKAVRSTNAMGASKRVMELALLRASNQIPISTARFANVAFSDGSLPFGFSQRIQKQQPLSAPKDVRRYFITAQESGQLCLMSCLLGDNRDLFYPKLTDNFQLTRFDAIATRYLENLGLEPVICDSEDEARSRVHELAAQKKWPCYFFTSDTTGEKDFEEFYTDADTLDLDRFQGLGVVKNLALEQSSIEALDKFLTRMNTLRQQGSWDRDDLLSALKATVPDFAHKETHKFLDNRM